jgi:hypothetical protein
MSDDDIQDACSAFMTPEYVAKIERRDPRFLSGTALETDMDIVWESCTTENKAIIWKWVTMLASMV